MNLAELSIPGSVIESAQYVLQQARDVSIESSRLPALARRITERLDQGSPSVDEAFGSTGRLQDDVNIVFFETAVNFCFWGSNEQAKWKVSSGGKEVGGWYGLAACFDRAVQQDVPVYSAEWMAALTMEKAQVLFQGVDNTPIPLLKPRVNNLVEAASFLLRTYGGQAMNLLEATRFSAPELVTEVVRGMPNYQDGVYYGGKWVWLLKRAQILASDLQQLNRKYPEFDMQHTEQLTAFADYRLPQILRYFGALEYSAPLEAKVDNGTLLPAGSSQEVEIRAATILAVEGLKQHVQYSAPQIDLGLWLLSQDLRDDPALQPHHRTLTMFY